MPLTIPTGFSDFKLSSCKRLANAWKITRQDGTVYRFTTFDRKITLADGEVYSPIGGVQQSASRRSDSLRDHDTEFRGVLTSDVITDDDLRAGKYREAAIEEYLLDWRVPWKGAIATHVYWISKTSFDGEVWEAECTGPVRYLRSRVGDVYGRTCRHDLGDSNCGVDVPGSYTVSNKAVVGLEDGEKRRIILGDAAAFGSYTDESTFDDGRLIWLTGDNAGLVGIVKSYRDADKRIELQLPMPFEIQAGDTFDVEFGCDKLLQTCIDKFSNAENNGSYPYIPGNDRMLQTPASKT